MPHSYVSCLVHCVFSTKERRRIITPAIQQRLWPYFGGIAREADMKALAVGGTDDHVHILLSMPSTTDIAEAMQVLKANSSKWVHETFGMKKVFAWQEGYGAFSIGISQIKATTAYIESQNEHHRKKTFQDEFRAFLDKHGIEYNERYIWG
jgi:putative transposase